jgi:hypothetical protein
MNVRRSDVEGPEAMKPAALVATFFLAVVALAHLARVAFHVGVIAGGFAIPMWMSVLAFVFTGGLSLALWRESRR